MSAAHMGMVFAAAGLDGSEKLLLLGLTNYTDPHGFCWPSEARLADDCGTSRSTVQRSKRKLIKRKLIKSVRRVNPKTGEPISNLTRVNLPKLASMARTRTDYDDDLINAITFDDDSEGDPASTLGGTPDDPEPTEDDVDLLKGHPDSHPESDRSRPRSNMTPTPGQDDAQSRTDPVGTPHLSPEGAQPRRGEERENEASPEEPTNQHQEAAEQVVAAYGETLGRPVINGTRAKLLGQAAELLAAGFPADWLADRAREMAPKRWTDLVQHAERSSVPFTRSSAEQRRAKAPWCGECDEFDRTTETVRYDGPDGVGCIATVRCPKCHPANVHATA